MNSMFRHLHSKATSRVYNIRRATAPVVELLDGGDVAEHDTGNSHLLTSSFNYKCIAGVHS